jgi:hypothetical protein
LEIAVVGRADCLVTGDQDLLVLDPFQGIPIVTPARFLAIVSRNMVLAAPRAPSLADDHGGGQAQRRASAPRRPLRGSGGYH